MKRAALHASHLFAGQACLEVPRRLRGVATAGTLVEILFVRRRPVLRSRGEMGALREIDNYKRRLYD